MFTNDTLNSQVSILIKDLGDMHAKDLQLESHRGIEFAAHWHTSFAISTHTDVLRDC